jgi:Yip1-like protein
MAAGITGMFNVFIDPAATARVVPAPLAWLWPLLIGCIVSIPYTIFVLRLSVNIMRQNPTGLPADQVNQAVRGMEMYAKIGPFVTPVIIVIFLCVLSLLVMLTASMLSMRVKFRDVFTLMSLCGLISTLQVVASYFVLRAKADELGSMQQLQPPFGLDIFFSELKGPLFAILNFFSLFEIWYLVIFTFALAYFTRSSKGKAFAAITPVWLIPLLFKIVGSFFQRS